MSQLGDVLRGESADAGLLSDLTAAEPDYRINWTQRDPVEHCEELDRILALPRRPPELSWSPEANALACRSTAVALLFRPEGCGDPKCPFTRGLRPIQLRALLEARESNGLLAPIGVGGGKALITLLAGAVLGARTTVLLVPTQLVAQTYRVAEHMAQHWKIPNVVGGRFQAADVDQVLHVVAYSTLSSRKQHDILDRLRPDLIVADECHRLKNGGAALTKRFLRYMRTHSTTRFIGLSGTIAARSLKDFWHLSKLALGPDRSPVPTHYPTLDRWAAALDPGPTPAPAGALELLCRPGESPREGFARRLVETEGVVATSESQFGGALNLYERPVHTPPEVETALHRLRSDWVTPWGDPVRYALEILAYGCQLSAGLMYRRIWPRNEPEHIRNEWLEARREWFCEVRDRLKLSLPGQDSPELCAMAAAAGRWHSETWDRWAAIKDQAKPDTEDVWISDFLAHDAIEWGRKHVGIVWSSFNALTYDIARLGDFPYYGAADDYYAKPTPRMLAERDRRIHQGTWKKDTASAWIDLEDGSRTIVASINAHGEGKNLQVFSKNLVTTFPTAARIVEQLLGRTHRPGQAADEVEFYVYRHTPEMCAAIEKAREVARFVQETTQQQQKLLTATCAF